MEQELEIGQPLPDLRETRAFGQVLSEVGEVFQYWYGIKPKELPCVTPETIIFLPSEEFTQKLDASYLTKNLLARTLLNLGAKKEEVFASSQQQPPLFAHALRLPKIVYVSRERLRELNSLEPEERTLAAILLGVQLIDMNLLLLPNPVGLKGEYWLSRLREKLKWFLEANIGKIPLERRNEIEKAWEIFDYFLETDESLRFLACGGEIVAMMKQEKEEEPLIFFGSEFNQKVVFSLGNKLKRRLIARLAGRHFSQRGMEKFLRIWEKRAKDTEIWETGEFLRRLKLGDSQTLFEKFRQSQIPEVYLQRLKVRPNLPPYPLD